MIRRLCDKCHFYEDEECTNAWDCSDDFRAHISSMPKREVEDKLLEVRKNVLANLGEGQNNETDLF